MLVAVAEAVASVLVLVAVARPDLDPIHLLVPVVVAVDHLPWDSSTMVLLQQPDPMRTQLSDGSVSTGKKRNAFQI